MQSLPLSISDASSVLPIVSANHKVQPLTDVNRHEALNFLGSRDVHCAYLPGLVQDNGLNSPRNRGTFYAYRNSRGEIEGIALIGHATIIETLSDDALKALAETAGTHRTPHLIMCEETHSDQFWAYYSTGGQTMRRTRRELLFELRWPTTISPHCQRLRLATTKDLDTLISVHAEMAYEESGVDPRDVDHDGYVDRYTQRIEKGRTWVLIENDQLIFKADVVTETRQSAYVEGVWVHPAERRQGYGRNCMGQLARMLLWRSRSICLFVNDENQEAQVFYKRCGYHTRGVYNTIFLQ